MVGSAAICGVIAESGSDVATDSRSTSDLKTSKDEPLAKSRIAHAYRIRTNMTNKGARHYDCFSSFQVEM
jgi:hypothetical protein